jgi:hypothetical protein
MKKKAITLLIIGIFVLASLTFVEAKLVKCPECKGTGEIDCPECDGTGVIDEGGEIVCPECSGAGTITPKIQKTSTTVEQKNGLTVINGTFTNKEDFDVEATVTADFSNHKNSTTVDFPAGETTIVSLEISYLGTYSSQMQVVQHSSITVELDEITCPECDGAGYVEGTTECPECEGTGTIICPECDGEGYVEESAIAQTAGDFPWVAVEAAVAVVAVAGGGTGAFLVLKKRRVSERSLRKLTSREFNEWVLKRVDGKPASSRDASLGIDGYTSSGQPLLIKQTDNVGMTVIDTFAAALARSRARGGVIVAYSYGGDAVRGKVRAQMNYKLTIETLTVQDLIDTKRRL